MDEPVVAELVALAHERRVPVLIHAGRGIPALGENTVRLAERHPDATLILAHAAISDLAWLWRVLPAHPNVLIDTSWWNPVDLVALFALSPPANVVWASDSPYGRPVPSAVWRLRCALQAGCTPDAAARDRRRHDRARARRRAAGGPRAAAGRAARAARPAARARGHEPVRAFARLAARHGPDRVARARAARMRGRDRRPARRRARRGARAARPLRGRARAAAARPALPGGGAPHGARARASHARRTCRCPRCPTLRRRPGPRPRPELVLAAALLDRAVVGVGHGRRGGAARRCGRRARTRRAGRRASHPRRARRAPARQPHRRARRARDPVSRTTWRPRTLDLEPAETAPAGGVKRTRSRPRRTQPTAAASLRTWPSRTAARAARTGRSRPAPARAAGDQLGDASSASRRRRIAGATFYGVGASAGGLVHLRLRDRQLHRPAAARAVLRLASARKPMIAGTYILSGVLLASPRSCSRRAR